MGLPSGGLFFCSNRVRRSEYDGSTFQGRAGHGTVAVRQFPSVSPIVEFARWIIQTCRTDAWLESA